MTRRLCLAVFLVSLLLSSACVRDGSTAAAARTTTSETPTSTTTALVDSRPSRASLAAQAPSLRVCQAGELQGSGVQVSEQLSSGNGYADKVLANRSTSACRLAGTPGLRLLDARGRTIATHLTQGDLETVDPPVNPDPVALLPGNKAEYVRGNASVLVTWPSFPGRKCSTQPPAASTVELSFPSGGTVRIDLAVPRASEGAVDAGHVAPCDGRIAVRSFQPANEPAYG